MSGERCGSYDGRNDHRRLDEPVCEACRDAARLYQTFRRRRLMVGLPVERHEQPRWVETMPDFPAVGSVLQAGLVMNA